MSSVVEPGGNYVPREYLLYEKFFFGTSCGAPDGGSGEAATAVAVIWESPIYLGAFLINVLYLICNRLPAVYCLSPQIEYRALNVYVSCVKWQVTVIVLCIMHIFYGI